MFGGIRVMKISENHFEITVRMGIDQALDVHLDGLKNSLDPMHHWQMVV